MIVENSFHNRANYNVLLSALKDWHNGRGGEVFGKHVGGQWRQLRAVKFDNGIITGFDLDADVWFTVHDLNVLKKGTTLKDLETK
jgi:hypothetical protein